jgi:hypothetical protein
MLHLDMARTLDIFFDQDMRVAERRCGLALAGGECVGEVGCGFDLAHPLAAAACDRLDEHGIADFGGLLPKEVRVLVRAHIARGDGHARRRHQFLGCILQPHRGDASGRWPDPDQPRVDHSLRELGIFGQEAIARMNRLRFGGERGGDDLLPNQIALPRRTRANVNSLIGLPHMQRLGIGIRINRDGANAHRACCADDAASNFAAIGDEEGCNHRKSSPERGGGPPRGGGGVGWGRLPSSAEESSPTRPLRLATPATSPFRGGFMRFLHSSTIEIKTPSIFFKTCTAGIRIVSNPWRKTQASRTSSRAGRSPRLCDSPSTSIANRAFTQQKSSA